MMLPLLPAALLSVSMQASPFVHGVAQPHTLLDTALAAPVAKRLTLDLRSGGSVKITGGTDNVVRIRVTDAGRACGDCGVTLEQGSGGLQVRSTRVASAGSLQFEIEVPEHFDVQLASAGGEVRIEGVDGEIKGKTEAGALELRRLSGIVDLETKRGDVSLRESYASGRVHTTDGRVLLEDVGGTVAGSTASGKLIERRVERPVAQ
jgi:DUF4097 and DUF4098 domain-containing protein YvlB